VESREGPRSPTGNEENDPGDRQRKKLIEKGGGERRGKKAPSSEGEHEVKAGIGTGKENWG